MSIRILGSVSAETKGIDTTSQFHENNPVLPRCKVFNGTTCT